MRLKFLTYVHNNNNNNNNKKRCKNNKSPNFVWGLNYLSTMKYKDLRERSVQKIIFLMNLL